MEEHTNNNEASTDGSKSKGKKICFTAVFSDITIKGIICTVLCNLLNLIENIPNIKPDIQHLYKTPKNKGNMLYFKVTIHIAVGPLPFLKVLTETDSLIIPYGVSSSDKTQKIV